jgi:hypothetical protein
LEFRKEILSFAATQMNPKGRLVSEITHTEINTLHIFTCKNLNKKNKLKIRKLKYIGTE